MLNTPREPFKSKPSKETLENKQYFSFYIFPFSSRRILNTWLIKHLMKALVKQLSIIMANNNYHDDKYFSFSANRRKISFLSFRCWRAQQRLKKWNKKLFKVKKICLRFIDLYILKKLFCVWRKLSIYIDLEIEGNKLT